MSLIQKAKGGMGNPDWNISMVDIHLRKLLWVYRPVHVEVKGNDRADRLAGKATLRSGYKAKDITPSIAWGRGAWKEETLDDLH